MSETVNTPTIAESLVNSSHRYRKEVMALPFIAIEEMTKHMRLITNLKGKETEATIKPAGKFRPYHSEKVVGETGEILARTLETFPIEMLEEFDPENLYKTVYGQPIDADKIDLPIVRRLLTEEMKSACRGLCDTVISGVRVADGTDGADCFNGFDTIIALEKTAGNITLAKKNFMTLGTLTEYNIGDKLFLMYKMISEGLRGDSKKKLKLIVSYKEKEMYNVWYAMKYGHGNFAGVPEQQYLHGTDNKVEIVALPGMAGAAHCFITTQENMKIGVDTLPKDTKYEVRRADNPNVVQMHVKIYMGVEFACIEPEFLFVASRTVKSDDVFMLSDKDEVVFDDTVLTQSSTAKVKLYGFNMTAATEVTIEGTDAEMFASNANSVSAANANAAEGKELTITFTPTTSAGDKTAVLHVKNVTDDVDLRIILKGKGTNA